MWPPDCGPETLPTKSQSGRPPFGAAGSATRAALATARVARASVRRRFIGTPLIGFVRCNSFCPTRCRFPYGLRQVNAKSVFAAVAESVQNWLTLVTVSALRLDIVSLEGGGC